VQKIIKSKKADKIAIVAESISKKRR